ncbi:MAG: CoA-binding protein [Candidatus Pacebacteria bacterium]|nr:CoA-binding protein [Candidatus Paceibacterota bacterium]
MNLEKLFSPQSVAIVGASPEEGTVGSVLAKNALELGYKGKVFLVNPKHTEIFGQKCYHSLAEISEPVDLAVVELCHHRGMGWVHHRVPPLLQYRRCMDHHPAH